MVSYFLSKALIEKGYRIIHKINAKEVSNEDIICAVNYFKEALTLKHENTIILKSYLSYAYLLVNNYEEAEKIFIENEKELFENKCFNYLTSYAKYVYEVKKDTNSALSILKKADKLQFDIFITRDIIDISVKENVDCIEYLTRAYFAYSISESYQDLFEQKFNDIVAYTTKNYKKNNAHDSFVFAGHEYIKALKPENESEYRKKAIKNYLEAIKFSHDTYDYYYLAENYFKLKEFDKAEEYFNKISDDLIKLSEGSRNYQLGDMLHTYGLFLYEVKKDYKKADEIVHLAYKVSSKNIYRLTMSKILFDANDKETALDLLIRAKKVEQTNKEIDEFYQQHIEEINEFNKNYWLKNDKKVKIKEILTINSNLKETEIDELIEANGAKTLSLYAYYTADVYKILYHRMIDLNDEFMINLLKSNDIYYVVYYFLKEILPQNKEGCLTAINTLFLMGLSKETVLKEMRSRFYDSNYKLKEVIVENIDLFGEDFFINEIKNEQLIYANDNLFYANVLLTLNYDKYIEDVKNIFYTNKYVNSNERYQYSLILNLINDEKFKKQIILETIENYLENISKNLKLKVNIVKVISDYIANNTKPDNFYQLVEEFANKLNGNFPGYNYIINYSFKYDLNDEFYKRINTTGIILDYNNIFPYLIKNYKIEITDDEKEKENIKLSDYENLCEIFNIDKKYVYKYLIQCVVTFRNKYTLYKTFLPEIIKNNSEFVFDFVKDYDSEKSERIIPELYLIDKNKVYDFCYKLTSDSSKSLRNTVLEVLSEYKDKEDDYKKLLDSKKAPGKESGIRLLTALRVEGIEKLLKDVYEKETADALRKVINECLVEVAKDNTTKTTQIVDGKIKQTIENGYTKELIIQSSSSFVVKNGKEPIVGAGFLEIATLPELLWKDDKTKVDLTVVYNFINSFAMTKSAIPSIAGKQIGLLFEEKSLKEFVLTVYNRWDKEAKTKWIFGIVSAFGGNDFVPILKKQITELANANRGMMAGIVVEALAMIGTSRALQIVDFISRKDKNKQVKNAAIKALEIAGKELNLSKDELLDKIIPNFGFDLNGKLELDFGVRKFTLKLTPEEFVIFDEKGKEIKALPKPNKDDDAVKSENATLLFKEIKKEIKDQAKLQKERLESSLSKNRLWNKSEWTELFTENPMMKTFAISLIWGIYENDKIQSTFRYNEDNSFSDINDDTFTLPENCFIGMIHPIDLTKEQIENWKTVLSDYQIKQPFKQLERNIYNINKENENDDIIKDFQGFMIARISLKSKLSKAGWSTGSVEDGGCYTYYKKDIYDQKITVKLDFLGDCMGGYDDSKEVPLYGLSFCKYGTYNAIELKNISKRLYSEIYGEVKTIAESGSGFNVNWEKESW